MAWEQRSQKVAFSDDTYARPTLKPVEEMHLSSRHRKYCVAHQKPGLKTPALNYYTKTTDQDLAVADSGGVENEAPDGVGGVCGGVCSIASRLPEGLANVSLSF